MSEPFLAEIRMVGFNFAPRGWALCDGQILPINQNQSLYSLLGTTYGGDGRINFALPDLRGRIPFHVGGNGVTQGSKGGEENHTLQVNEMPAHKHIAGCYSSEGAEDAPQDKLFAESSVGDLQYSTGEPNGQMHSSVVSSVGGQSHDNMPPYLALNFVIALQGLFPSRN